MGNIGNVQNLLVNSLVALNLQGVMTQETLSNLNDNVTKANETLSENWTTSKESSPKDPGYAAWYYLQIVATGKAPKGKPSPKNPPSGASSIKKNDMQGWINCFLGKNPDYDSFSSSFMADVYNVYEGTHPGKDAGPIVNQISGAANIVQTTGQADQQPNQNAISLVNKESEQIQTNQGSLSQVVSGITSLIDNDGSNLQQIVA